MNHNAAEPADAYLAHFQSKQSATAWAEDHVWNLTRHRRWEDLRDIVLAIARREDEVEPDALAYVAAGPLEDILSKAGDAFIDRVEHEAKFNRRFGRLLTGVWPSRAPPEMRERVIRFCRAFADPIDGVYPF